jgi:hypothetical protein
LAALTQRLKHWYTMSHILPQPENPEVEAGRLAEEFLKELVDSNLKFKNGYAFLGKRIPSARHSRRFEVDLIVLTRKHIHVLEVKNWSGELYTEGRFWIQTRRNGTEVEHPSLTSHNHEKKEALISFLKTQGISIDPAIISQKIIFMNHRLRILSQSIIDNPNVIQAHELDRYLATQRGTSGAERFVHSVIELLLDKEKSGIVLGGLFKSMHGQDFKAAIAALRSLETWDQLRLYGGKTLVGDGLQLITQEGTVDLKALPNGGKFRLKWLRSKVMGLLLCGFGSVPIGKLHLPGDKILLTPDDQIKFHLAMEERPSFIPAREVDQFIRG